MRYLLDTGLLSAYLMGRSGAVALLGPWIWSDEAATSIVVYGEVVEYLRGMSNSARRVVELRQLLVYVHPITLSLAVLEGYADLRRQMRPTG